MNVKLLIAHHLEFLGLNRGCTGSSESSHVKMPHCWKSHATAQVICVFKSVFGLNLSYFPVGPLKCRVPESRVPLISFCRLIEQAHTLVYMCGLY